MPVNFERLDAFGGQYLVSYTGGRLLRGADLVEPETGGGYWLSHPDRPDELEEYQFAELWEQVYGVLIPGYSSYTLNAAGRVYDNEGNRVALETLPLRDNRGNHVVPEPAVRLIADDASEHVVRISDLLTLVNTQRIPGQARTPSPIEDPDDDGDRSWLRKLGAQLSWSPPEPGPPPPPAIASSRGRMGGTNSRRGHMGSSGNGSRGRMGRS